MDFKKIWFRFCSYVLKSKRESEIISDKEFLFRDSIVEYLNLELGWDKHFIETEYIVPSGSSDKRCDIMVFDNNEEAFLIECKRPNNKQSIRNRKQLDSYIATTRIGIGIYFGEFIEVFYDERSDKDFALPVLRIEYNPENNPNGEKFVELFHKESFNKDTLMAFCKERYLPISYLNSELTNSESYIKKLIEKDLSNRFGYVDEALIKDVMSKYSVSVSYKICAKSHKTAQKEDAEFIIQNVNEQTKVNVSTVVTATSSLAGKKKLCLQQEIKQALSLMDRLYGSEEKIRIIIPISDGYFEKIKLFKLDTGIIQKDTVLYAFYKYVNSDGNDNNLNMHLKYHQLVQGHQKNGIKIEMPVSLWKKALELFGAKVTKKQIAAEAVCCFLDNVYSA